MVPVTVNPGAVVYPYSTGIYPKLEWLIVGALIFLAILASVEIVHVLLNMLAGTQFFVDLWPQIVYALFLMSLTLLAIYVFRGNLNLYPSTQPAGHVPDLTPHLIR